MREHVLGPEQRRSVPPLPAPIIAFGIEQTAADRRAEHVVVEWLLGIAVDVVEQDRLDQGWDP